MSDQQYQGGREYRRDADSRTAVRPSAAMQSGDEVEIDLGELIGVLLHWLWVMVLCGLLCGIACYCYSRYMLPVQYQSTTKFYVLDRSDNSTTSTYTELQTGSQLTEDYVEIITSRAVLEAVMEDNDLLGIYSYSSFASKVSVDTPEDTRIVSITVTDTDPAMAQKLADDIRIEASELILETMQIDAVNTFEEANFPTSKSSPNNTKWAMIGILFGVVAAAAVIVIRYLLDDTVKTSEDVEKYLNLSTLALIPYDDNSDTAEKEKKGRKTKGRAEKGRAERGSSRSSQGEVYSSRESTHTGNAQASRSSKAASPEPTTSRPTQSAPKSRNVTKSSPAVDEMEASRVEKTEKTKRAEKAGKAEKTEKEEKTSAAAAKTISRRSEGGVPATAGNKLSSVRKEEDYFSIDDILSEEDILQDEDEPSSDKDREG